MITNRKTIMSGMRRGLTEDTGDDDDRDHPTDDLKIKKRPHRW